MLVCDSTSASLITADMSWPRLVRLLPPRLRAQAERPGRVSMLAGWGYRAVSHSRAAHLTEVRLGILVKASHFSRVWFGLPQWKHLFPQSIKFFRLPGDGERLGLPILLVAVAFGGRPPLWTSLVESQPSGLSGPCTHAPCLFP